MRGPRERQIGLFKGGWTTDVQKKAGMLDGEDMRQ
jgi:hypothetical protein